MRRLLCLCLLACAVYAGNSPYASWAREVVKAVRTGDADRTMVLIDARALIERATEGGPDDLRTQFLANGMKSVRKRGGILHEIIPDVARGGHFGLVRVTERDGEPCARFRVAFVEGGINYVDFKLRQDGKGVVSGVDMYNHQNGEWMSETLRRFFLPLVRMKNQSLWEKLVDSEGDWIKGVEGARKMMALERAGQVAEALEEYDALPDVIRKQKAIMVIRIRIAGQVDDKEYKQAIDEYLALYPDDPSALLVAIDGYFLEERYEAALESVKALDKAVGGDPYLGILRSNLLLAAGKPGQARESAQTVIKHGPDWMDARFALLEVELQEKRFAEVLKLLGLLEDKFRWDFGNLEEAEAYAEFVKSPEYKAWKSR